MHFAHLKAWWSKAKRNCPLDPLSSTPSSMWQMQTWWNPGTLSLAQSHELPGRSLLLSSALLTSTNKEYRGNKMLPQMLPWLGLRLQQYLALAQMTPGALHTSGRNCAVLTAWWGLAEWSFVQNTPGWILQSPLPESIWLCWFIKLFNSYKGPCSTGRAVSGVHRKQTSLLNGQKDRGQSYLHNWKR